VFGYGVQDALSWVAMFFGYGMISVALTAVSVEETVYHLASLTCTTDTHHHHGLCE